MKCILCNQRKGRRYCPAKNAMICAQCCGEKRILEIDCPESCQYLKVGRSHEAALENARHFRVSDPMKQEKHARVLDRFDKEVAHLEYLLAAERRASRDLTDRDVAEALDLLLETYRTEEKGILYEKGSSNLRVESLRRQIRDLVQFYRNPTEARQQLSIDVSQERLPLGAAIECLELIRDVVASHVASRRSLTGYVDFLARVMPRGKELKEPTPSIIIPG